MNKSKIAGIAFNVPDNVVTYHDLEEMMDTTDEWIQTRTGIGQRRVIGENESLIDLATDAAMNAVKMADWDVKTIDLIILDYLLWSSTSAPNKGYS